MRFKEALERIEGLRFVADRMEILSELGRERLMNLEFHHIDLKQEHLCMREAAQIIGRKESNRDLETLWQLLMQARNIRTTVKRLEEGKTLDDVELFEIKGLAITGASIAKKISEWHQNNVLRNVALDAETFEPLGKVVEILDPENTGSRSFHIYNAYSEELATCRAAINRTREENTEEHDRLTAESLILEERVRERLSDELKGYAATLQKTMDEIGWLDLLWAKVRFVDSYRLTLPKTGAEEIRYKGLRYLPAESALKREGKMFQPVDIAIEKGVTLITGANMGGKTVTLKSLALAQAMAQFGFCVAADEAEVAEVDSIDISLGDAQSALSGLSSFGAEILNIDRIVTEARTPGRTQLILIDEPGRTTNPDEGKAIVNAVAGMLSEADAFTLITTHYSGIASNGKRLRVRGLKDTDGGTLSVKRLSELMDYSLVEDREGNVPREALRIARLLGVNEDFAKEIEKNTMHGDYVPADENNR